MLKKNKELENAKKIKPFLKISLSFIGIVVFYYLHVLLIIYKGSYNIWGIKIIIYIDLILLVSLIVEFIKHPELYIRKSKIKSSYLISSPFTKSTNKKIVISQKDKEIIQNRIQILINERFFFTDPKNNFQEFSKHIKYPDYIIRLYLKSQESSYIDIKNKVIEYIESNYQMIEHDMNNRNSSSKNRNNSDINHSNEHTKTRKKREELSVSACKCIKKESVKIVVKFDL